MHSRLRRAHPSAVTFGPFLACAMAIAMIGPAAARGASAANERYVTLAYSDLLARPPSAGELSGFAGGLDSMTLTRAAFASSVLGSAEFCDDKAASFFSLLLRRGSTAAQRSGYVSLLQSGWT